MIDEQWFKKICRCKNCLELYNIIELDSLINLLLEEESEEYISKFFKIENKKEIMNKFY